MFHAENVKIKLNLFLDEYFENFKWAQNSQEFDKFKKNSILYNQDNKVVDLIIDSNMNSNLFVLLKFTNRFNQ